MWAIGKKVLKQPVIISSAIATVLILGLQKLQVLQTVELKVYDQMMQMRVDPGTDPRLLIVAITENDLEKWNWPIPGEVLERALGKLEEGEPRAIGLDIFRDLPVQPGHEKLLERLQQSDIIIPVCKHADAENAGIAPPQGMEPERVGFSDVVEDPDGAIRRNLVSVNVEESDRCQSPYSLSWQLAIKYLEVGGIQPQITANQEIKLRNTLFKPLQTNSGAYQNADTKGYQLLLNYRSPRQVAQQVTLTDVLSNQVKPELIKDRIILVGSTAPSLKDIFNTPYTSGKTDNSGRMAGIEIHGHIVSQILSTVLNNQRLFWFLPEWGEILWISGWSLVGGFLAWRIRHPLGLGIAEGTSLLFLFGSNFVIFTQAGWFPVISPALGLVITAGSVLAYSAYESKQEQEKTLKRVQEQKELIAQLQSFVNQAYQGTTNFHDRPTVTNYLPPTGTELFINTVLNQRYKITQSLGGGGFSNTYLAQDIQRPGNPECVVKQMRPANQQTEYINILRRLFINEADILETLGKHQQIPYLLAFFEENQQFYLVQEFISGHPLSQELTPGVPRSRTETVNILKEVLEVLSFVHSYGVIHRDIKPSNLIRRKSDAHIVLIDFGAVKQVQPQKQGEQPENQTIAIGTPGYAPGEQMSGMPRLNSDIYALGMIGIQALTGVYPKLYRRDGSTGVVIIPTESSTGEQNWQYWWQLADSNEVLTKLIDKMVHLDFTQRYQSATEVLNILETL